MIELFRKIMGLPPGASSIADGIDTLHAVIALSSFVVGFGLMIYVVRLVMRYRRKSANQTTEHVAATPRSEAILAGLVTVAFLAFWVVGFRQYGEMTAPPANADTVYVDAKQWMWKFGYPDGRATNDVLTVPAGRPIKLVMTSRDVIHSFYVPAFRVKQDVLPGRYSTTWFIAKDPGTYPIYCAEFCGVSHSAMLGTVQVLSEADYQTWKSSVQIDVVERGKEIATRRGCVSCHSLDGKPGTGPTFRGLYGSTRKLANGTTVLADEAYLTRSIVEPNAEVVQGFPPAMPTYQGILEPIEVGALVEMMRGLK